MWVADASVSLPLGRPGNVFTTTAFYKEECSRPEALFYCISSGKLAARPRNIKEATHTSFAHSENVYTKYF